MKTNKNKTLKLSEQEYLAQLQMLYRNCPCPRILYTISELGYTMGEIAAGVSTLGCRATAFEIVDLLNGRLQRMDSPQHCLAQLRGCWGGPWTTSWKKAETGNLRTNSTKNRNVFIPTMAGILKPVKPEWRTCLKPISARAIQMAR